MIFLRVYLFTFLLVFLLVPFASAITIQPNTNVAMVSEMDAGQYVAPSGYDTIAQVNNAHLSHNQYYTWGIDDLSTDIPVTSVDIVFHGIYDDSGAENFLNVYLYNDADTMGYDYAGRDESSIDGPNWMTLYDAEYLGTWQYDHDSYSQPNDKFDVVFTVTDAELLSYLFDGGSFGIGIDPDCLFVVDSITVSAPVPEPTTLLLLGTGLCGVAGLRRRKSN